MTEHQQDQALKQWFTDSVVELDDNTFIRDVMQHVDQRARSNRWKWIALGAVVILLEVFLLEFASNFSQVLSTTLIDMGDGMVAQLVQPVNSVAGLLAIMVLAVHHVMRRYLT